MTRIDGTKGVKRYPEGRFWSCVLAKMSSPLLSPVAAKSDVSMADRRADLLPSLHRFLWPQGCLETASSPWVSPLAQKVLWWTLVSFAGLDIVHPVPYLTQEWWCAFLVLWIVPWISPTSEVTSWARVATWLSSLVLFSWLVVRTQSAIMESTTTWVIFPSTTWWKLLSRPMRATIAAAAAAALMLYPLRRVVGHRAATIIAVLASLPLALRLASYVLLPSQQPLAIPIRIYSALIPGLVMAAAASLPTRFSPNLDRIPGYQGLRILLRRLLDGRLNAFLALFILYGGSIAGFFLAFSWCRAPVQNTPAAFAIYSLVVLGSFLFALLSALATWRSLARAGRRHVIFDNLATFGRLFIGISLSLVVLVGFFGVMPLAGNYVSESLLRMSGPAWSIAPATSPGVLRLTGEFQDGVSDALASALAEHPSIRRLELDSPGGDTDQALSMAALVEEYSLSTFVGDQCASACTIVFVAGRERLSTAAAKLGFHRARSSLWFDAPDADKVNGRLISYFESKGIEASFVQKAFRVPSNDIWYPSLTELLAAGIISSAPQNGPGL